MNTKNYQFRKGWNEALKDRKVFSSWSRGLTSSSSAAYQIAKLNNWKETLNEEAFTQLANSLGWYLIDKEDT